MRGRELLQDNLGLIQNLTTRHIKRRRNFGGGFTLEDVQQYLVFECVQVTHGIDSEALRRLTISKSDSGVTINRLDTTVCVLLYAPSLAGVRMTDENIDKRAAVCPRLKEIHPDFHAQITSVCSACNGKGGGCVIDAMYDVVWSEDPSSRHGNH